MSVGKHNGRAFLFVFACNAKRFAIAILFFLFLIASAIFLALPMFNFSLTETSVTTIEPVSLDTLANVFVLALFTFISGVGGQYLFNMQLEFFENGLACITS